MTKIGFIKVKKFQSDFFLNSFIKRFGISKRNFKKNIGKFEFENI